MLVVKIFSPQVQLEDTQVSIQMNGDTLKVLPQKRSLTWFIPVHESHYVRPRRGRSLASFLPSSLAEWSVSSKKFMRLVAAKRRLT